jgi:hypothetical protein
MRLRALATGGILFGVQGGDRITWSGWRRQDLEEQRRRLSTVPIDDRLCEVIAWSAALLADAIERRGMPWRTANPDPVGLGGRRR